METATINVKQSRFSDADWFEPMQKLPIIVGGVGSIGSWLSLFLARAGAELYVYDFDNADEVNLAGQLYGTEHVGQPKTEAIKRVLSNFVGEGNYLAGQFNNEKYTKDTMSNNIVFSCFDNMEARKVMFENWVEYCKDSDDEIKLFIDGRLTAETYEVFFVTPDRIDKYRETLFSDAEAQDLPCSFKSTSHVAAGIAGAMFTGLSNHLANHHTGLDIREVPFKIDYSSQLFLMTCHE